ncbi:MAG TPA: hypothetical protein VHU87_13825 [Rhizomicrobium sp.]|jgi:hypothetical protein|nr:hypothetical protein [Rhizomicrobium sp.]
MNLETSRRSAQLFLFFVAAFFCAEALASEGELKISVEQAQSFAHAALGKREAGALLEYVDKSIDPNFYTFAAESPNNTSGSPIIAYLMVNPFNGDVWNVGGSACFRQQTPALRTLQLSLQRQNHLDKRQYAATKMIKPSVCID